MKMIRVLIVALMLAGSITSSVTQATIPPVTNFAKMTVSAGYNSSATSIVLLSGHGSKLPSTFPFPLIWWNCTDWGAPEDDTSVEIVSVTARASDTLTVVRGHDGTSASNHNTGGKTYCMILGITKGIIDAIRTDISAAGVSGLVRSGTGTPEGSVSAGVGTLYSRTDGVGSTTLYRKQTGAGNTGWIEQPIFDPAIPGPIGGITPSTVVGTTIFAPLVYGDKMVSNMIWSTYGATIDIDAATATSFRITATNATPFTINNPTGLTYGQQITIIVRNTSGGALGLITWDTIYKMATFTPPANGKTRSVTFLYDSSNLIEIACSPEVPN
jgi:hypothetical protein